MLQEILWLPNLSLVLFNVLRMNEDGDAIPKK
jgi:hypothetical protein